MYTMYLVVLLAQDDYHKHLVRQIQQLPDTLITMKQLLQSYYSQGSVKGNGGRGAYNMQGNSTCSRAQDEGYACTCN